jgi:hypothetical protein
MANPNIVNVTSIYGTTAVQAVATSPTAIVSNASGSGSVYKVDSLIISNNDTSIRTVTIDVYRSSTAYPISTAVNIPVGGMYDVLSKYIYLNEGDSLRLTAGTSSTLTAVCSYEVIS